MRFIPEDLSEEHQEKLAIFESNLIMSSSEPMQLDPPSHKVDPKLEEEKSSLLSPSASPQISITDPTMVDITAQVSAQQLKRSDFLKGIQPSGFLHGEALTAHLESLFSGNKQ